MTTRASTECRSAGVASKEQERRRRPFPLWPSVARRRFPMEAPLSLRGLAKHFVDWQPEAGLPDFNHGDGMGGFGTISSSLPSGS